MGNKARMELNFEEGTEEMSNNFLTFQNKNGKMNGDSLF
jgi:hypothetical protein